MLALSLLFSLWQASTAATSSSSAFAFRSSESPRSCASGSTSITHYGGTSDTFSVCMAMTDIYSASSPPGLTGNGHSLTAPFLNHASGASAGGSWSTFSGTGSSAVSSTPKTNADQSSRITKRYTPTGTSPVTKAGISGTSPTSGNHQIGGDPATASSGVGSGASSPKRLSKGVTAGTGGTQPAASSLFSQTRSSASVNSVAPNDSPPPAPNQGTKDPSITGPAVLKIGSSVSFAGETIYETPSTKAYIHISTKPAASGDIPLNVAVSATSAPSSTIILDPNGAEATSSAHILQTNMILANRAASSYIINPSNTASKSTALAAVATAGLFAGHFKNRLPDIRQGGGGMSSSSCRGGGSLLGSMIGAVSCAAHSLDSVTSSIKGGKNIEGDLKNLGGIIQPLDPKVPTPNPPPNAKPVSPSDTTPKEDSDEEENERDDKQNDKDEDDEENSSSTTSHSLSVISSASTSRSTSTLSTITSAGTTIASKTQYLVFASTKADVSSIGNYINSAVSDRGSVAYLPPDDNAGIPGIWLVPEDPKAASSAGLNESEASAVGKLSGVSLVITNEVLATDLGAASATAVSTMPESKAPVTCSNDAKNTRPARLVRRAPPATEPIIVQQRNPNDASGLDVPLELRAIAQPSGVNPAPALNELNYVYRAPAGEGTWVYLIDSGVKRNHPEFTSGCIIAPFNEWIVIPPAANTDADEEGHGTQVASKICGEIVGVAKKTTIIPVKVASGASGIATWISIWRRILQDVERRQAMNPQTALGCRTVVNFSGGHQTTNPLTLMGMRVIKDIISSLMARDVIVIAAAGNSAVVQGNPEIRSYPAKWAADNFPIIVASSVNRMFDLSTTSNYGPQTCVWGIGENCILADVFHASGYVTDSGTSFVAPQASGLLAYFLSLSECPFSVPRNAVALNARQFFAAGTGAYPRRNTPYPVMWNQLDGRLAPEVPSFKRRQRRDASEVCTIRSGLATSDHPGTVSLANTVSTFSSTASSSSPTSSTEAPPLPNSSILHSTPKSDSTSTLPSTDPPSSSTVSTEASPPPAQLTTTSTPPPAPSPTAPYAEGNCSLHLQQWKDPDKDNGNYQLEVFIYDNNHTQIGHQPQKSANADKPIRLDSLLQDPLICIPEKQNDYLQFKLRSQSWPSNGPQCVVGGWDEHILEYNREMDCFFICTWGPAPLAQTLKKE